MKLYSQFIALLSQSALVMLFSTVGHATLLLADSDAKPAVPTTSSQTAHVELAGKRAKLTEQIQKLEQAVEAAEKSSEESDAGSDAEEELDLLKTLDLLYMQHVAALEQKGDIESQLRATQDELTALGNFGPPEAKPYSFLLLEDVRDQLAAEESRQEVTKSDLAGAQQLLEAAREAFDEAEHDRRLAQEALDECDEDAKDKLAAELKVAELESAIHQETVALRRVEIEVKTSRQEACELRQKLLTDKIELLAKDVKFTERDLKSRLDSLSRYTQELKKKLRDAESRLHKLDAQKVKSDAEFAAQPPDAAAQAAAKEAFQLARRVLHEEITLINQRVREIDQFKHYWECRYEVASGEADREDLETWHENLTDFLERVKQAEHSLALRKDEVRLDQATLFGRSREATGQDGAQQKWIDMQAEHLQRLAELCETSLLYLKASQRSGERFLEDLEARIEPERKKDWFGPAREAFLAFWNYELATVDDKPITVSKIVTALAYLLAGALLARFISRLLGHRILPRFGLNDGAAHAVQSISFYTLCVLFALLSLELVNLPFAAFTFLGGAAAIGIGFGSQSILNNFISGLILLAEQPIRVGDLVEIDGLQGTVEHIGARSTRVRTASNHEIVFPNSKLLENKVTNLTLTDDLVQTAIGLSLAPCMSVEETRESLLQAAALHPKVLASPAPVVLFKEFSTTTMSFELHFWLKLHSVMECRIIESEVRQAINGLFRDTDAATTSAGVVGSVGKGTTTPLSSAKPTLAPLRAAG